MGTIFFWLFSPLILNIAAFVPDIDTGSQLYQNWYYRYTVNTTWFPLSEFLAFLGLSIYGWVFINIVNIRRKNPFTSGNNTYKDFKTMLICVPIIFILSGVIMFRQTHDLSAYCKTSSNGLNESKTIYLKASGEQSYTNYSALQTVL